MNDIDPYKQAFLHGCLAADFLMLCKNKYGIDFTQNDERDLLIRGDDRTYKFYVVGIPKEFFNKYRKKVNIMVDNKYFTNVLIKELNDKDNFNIYHNKVSIKSIIKLLKSNKIICHVDDNLFGDYSHASHFVIIERAVKGKLIIVDPWSGKKSRVAYKKVGDSILNLKKHIKMCPIIYYL